ncbi:hypothetical protein AN958_09708 [Leucoagaricus sp. SymC.cos]|nr:hypothetical protein AN958_09708 [Leucoagaricus sp. SymC.cos]
MTSTSTSTSHSNTSSSSSLTSPITSATVPSAKRASLTRHKTSITAIKKRTVARLSISTGKLYYIQEPVPEYPSLPPAITTNNAKSHNKNGKSHLFGSAEKGVRGGVGDCWFSPPPSPSPSQHTSYFQTLHSQVSHLRKGSVPLRVGLGVGVQSSQLCRSSRYSGGGGSDGDGESAEEESGGGSGRPYRWSTGNVTSIDKTKSKETKIGRTHSTDISISSTSDHSPVHSLDHDQERPEREKEEESTPLYTSTSEKLLAHWGTFTFNMRFTMFRAQDRVKDGLGWVGGFVRRMKIGK